jgi:hypothetical protein
LLIGANIHENKIKIFDCPQFANALRKEIRSHAEAIAAAKLSRQGVNYELRENAFLKIDNWEQAQSLSDSIRVEDLHQVLDILASRYVPFLQRYGF